MRSIPLVLFLPLFDLVTPMPYVESQKLLDEANAWGFCCYDKGIYLQDLSDPGAGVPGMNEAARKSQAWIVSVPGGIERKRPAGHASGGFG